MQGWFSVSPGIAALIGSAARGQSDGVRFLLSGDLSQMAAQEEFLRIVGFTVGRSNVYPGLYTEDDFKLALKAIWDGQVAGWWHYESKYIKYGICTSEEFRVALDIECAKKGRRS